jgi:hypothetical protein
MSKTLNIQELTDAVLALVDTAESQKTAEVSETSSIKTDIGQEILKIAQQLDTAAEPAVTYEDIAKLLKKTSDDKLSVKDLVSIEEKTAAVSEETPVTAGTELRKLAAQLKEQHKTNKRDRLIKAAQLVTAAVSLEHLKEGLK